MSDVSLQNLTKNYNGAIAVSDINLEVEKGEFIALLGPSGCGKTTTLRMVAGFVEPTDGRIIVGGNDVTRLAPEKRNMGMVFQSYALFPHMTVRKNVEFGLSCHNIPAQQRPERIEEVLRLVGLAEYGDRFPKQLSGGQQQRVALARIMAIKPSLLLFDEPLSNLDAFLRVQMRSEIRQLQRRIGVTALFVTHDQEEAMTMADRIVVMSKGRIEQVGTPSDIYDHPKTRFVANFIGSANFFDGRVEGSNGSAVFQAQNGISLPLLENVPLDATANALAIRPERIDIRPPGEGLVEGRVLGSIQLGPMMEYTVGVIGGEAIRVQVQRRAGMPSYDHNQPVSLIWRPQDANLLAS
ncbi:ABC transporter ATP-binding protein [Pseudochelatococcus sp. G4_1912]|uniref:ABC transporter ATP-binding protein n=1 Tax=Pseudochelatococcus sp. G4_1912 TaxID=3114288 RepID=UPI0039C730C9